MTKATLLLEGEGARGVSPILNIEAWENTEIPRYFQTVSLGLLIMVTMGIF